MVKLVALYKKPANPAEFDEKYFNEHVPLTNKMPGLKRVEIAKVTGTPAGESEYYMIAELYFDSMDDLKKSMSSDEGKAAARQLMTFAKDVVYMMFASDEKVPATV